MPVGQISTSPPKKSEDIPIIIDLETEPSGQFNSHDVKVVAPTPEEAQAIVTGQRKTLCGFSPVIVLSCTAAIPAAICLVLFGAAASSNRDDLVGAGFAMFGASVSIFIAAGCYLSCYIKKRNAQTVPTTFQGV